MYFNGWLGWMQSVYNVKEHTLPRIALESKHFKIPVFPDWFVGKSKWLGKKKKKENFTLSSPTETAATDTLAPEAVHSAFLSIGMYFIH